MIVRASEDRFDLGLSSFRAFLSFDELYPTFLKKAPTPKQLNNGNEDPQEVKKISIDAQIITKDSQFNSLTKNQQVKLSMVQDTNKMHFLLKKKIDSKNRSRELNLSFKEFFELKGNGLNLGRIDLNNTKTVTLQGYDTEAPDFLENDTYL